MKKIFLFSLALMTTAFLNVFASTIDCYQALTAAMRKGNPFAIVLDLEQSTGKPGMPTGYFVPTAMMLVPATDTTPERVVTSHLHFTDHSGSPTYEYVKYTFYVDNTVVVQTTFYDPQNFIPRGSPHTFTTSLGKGIVVNTKDYVGPPAWLLRPH